jgi:DNA-binding NarL/FixJ family response regulator
MESIRVLIADDHSVVREGLSAMLSKQADIQVVGEAENGQEAVAKARELRPDIVLMDLRMPEVDGVAAMRRIRAENADIKFIVLTTYDTDEYIFPGIEAGARAYLLKDAPREELFRAIRAVFKGESVIEPAVAGRVLDRFAELSRQSGATEGLS